MATGNSTDNDSAFTNDDGIGAAVGKIDEIRALLSGASAMIDDEASTPMQEARILLQRARHEAQVCRLLFEGLPLEEAESGAVDYERDCEGPDAA